MLVYANGVAYHGDMPDAATTLLILKIAVIAVSLLLLASLVALCCRNYRLHGRINRVFFVLTLAAVVGLEVIVRIVSPEMMAEYFNEQNAWEALYIHLSFSVPAAVLLPVMLFTGLKQRGKLHYRLGILFLLLWVGTFVTGIFFLPSANPF